MAAVAATAANDGIPFPFAEFFFFGDSFDSIRILSVWHA